MQHRQVHITQSCTESTQAKERRKVCRVHASCTQSQLCIKHYSAQSCLPHQAGDLIFARPPWAVLAPAAPAPHTARFSQGQRYPRAWPVVSVPASLFSCSLSRVTWWSILQRRG